VLYARTHPDAEFRKRAAALNAATFASLESLFAVHAGEISHRNAAVAIPFAIAAIGSVLQDRLLFNDLGSTPALSHQELIAEATRMFQGYLGAAAE